MKITARTPSLSKQLKDAETDVARFVTGGMKDAEAGLKAELRSQIVAAGLGQRLANTWRGNVYPQGRASLNPAAYVYSNAPLIIDAFSRGATIRPVNGAKYLWIPTKNVPRTGRRVMTPSEVDSHFNSEFVVRPGRSGTLLAFIDVIAGLRNGFRRDTKGRRAQGRTAKPVLMFVLRKTVKLPKSLDLEGPANKWGARVPDLIAGRWR